MTPEEIKELNDAIAKSIDEKLNPTIEEMKRVAEQAKSQPVGEDAKEKLLHTDANYQFSALMTAIKKNDHETVAKIKAITNVMNETTAGDGGTLVPTLTDASLYELIKTSGQATNLCSVMPMATGNTLLLPNVSTGASGNWVTEQNEATPEKVALLYDTLAPKKWIGLVPFSNELFQDANPAIGQFLLSHLARAEAYALDTKVFQAANTTLTGVFYASNTFGNTQTLTTSNPSSITWKDLVAASLGVDMAYNPNPQWYMSRSVLSLVMQLEDDNRRPIYDYNTKTILGYPVNIVEQAPTSADSASKPIIIFGDLKTSIVGDVAGRSVMIADQGSITVNSAAFSLLAYDCSAIRVVKRWAFAPRTAGYSLIKTHA